MLSTISHVVRGDSTVDGLFSEKHPSVVNGRDGVVLPIAAYLSHRKKNGKSAETLRLDSIWLAEFWDYLDSQCIKYYNIVERDVVRYIDQGAKRNSSIIYLRKSDSEPNFLKTLLRKRDVIYDFLFVLEHRLQLIEGVIGYQEPIKSGMLSYRDRVRPSLGIDASIQDQGLRTALRKNKERSRRQRPTPSGDEAERIRQAASEWKGKEISAPTYYLIASLKWLGGARAGGACDLTVATMAAALVEEFPRAEYLAITDLGNLSGTKDDYLRRQIVDDLTSLKAKGRRFLFPRVLEKGSRPRGLPVRIDLFIEILDYIWGERARFVIARQTRSENAPSDHVFLSQMTADALNPGSVGKIMKELFRRAKVSGSGHRLRATFAEDIVRDLYLRDRALHGQYYNVDAILMLAAEYMGHSDPESLRHYINNILKSERALEGEPVVFPEQDAPTMRIIAQALSEKHGADELRTLLNRIAAGLKDSA